MKKLIFILILRANTSLGQSVTISPQNNSSIIETNASNKAVLMPSVSNTTAINTPIKGMVVFDDATGTLSYYNGTSWIPMPSSTSIGWANNGTNIYTNNSGNVGINSSNPATKLEINGDISIKNTVYLNGINLYHNIDMSNRSLIHSGSSGQIITGLSGGTEGKMVFISAAYSFTILTNNSGSFIYNQIKGNQNGSQTLTLSGCILIYNSDLFKWVILASW